MLVVSILAWHGKSKTINTPEKKKISASEGVSFQHVNVTNPLNAIVNVAENQTALLWFSLSGPRLVCSIASHFPKVDKNGPNFTHSSVLPSLSVPPSPLSPPPRFYPPHPPPPPTTVVWRLPAAPLSADPAQYGDGAGGRRLDGPGWVPGEERPLPRYVDPLWPHTWPHTWPHMWPHQELIVFTLLRISICI